MLAVNRGLRLIRRRFGQHGFFFELALPLLLGLFLALQFLLPFREFEIGPRQSITSVAPVADDQANGAFPLNAKECPV